MNLIYFALAFGLGYVAGGRGLLDFLKKKTPLEQAFEAQKKKTEQSMVQAMSNLMTGPQPQTPGPTPSSN